MNKKIYYIIIKLYFIFIFNSSSDGYEPVALRTRSSGSSRGSTSDQDNVGTQSPLTEVDEQEDFVLSQESLYGHLLPLRGEQAKK